MRSGSERVPMKNTRNFSDVTGGLCKIKLDQLLKCTVFNKIIISTDDPKVIDISKSFNSNRLEVAIRPKRLATSEASTDDLVRHAAEVMPDGHVLWTHVTSPFINTKDYEDIVQAYFSNLGSFDSLMTVTKIQKFLWKDNQPINYDRKSEKWPRTQTLEPIWEINSGAFIAPRQVYLEQEDRIGKAPFLYELTSDVSYDIDWLHDFNLAEIIYKKRILTD